MALFPALAQDEQLRALLAYFIWSSFRLEDGSVVVNREVLMRCAGTKNRSFNGRALLDRFSEAVLPLHITGELNEATGELREWHWMEGKARQLFVMWTDEALAAIEQERALPVMERREMYFVSGLAFTRKSRTRAVQEAVEEAACTGKEPAVKLKLLTTLNGLPSNRFASLEERIAEVEERIRRELPAHKQAQQLGVLQNIAETLKPVYGAVENTHRLYETTGGFTFIKSEYRAVLAPSWQEYDLEASQLRIAAYRWCVEGLKGLFEVAQKPWPILLRGLGVGAEFKPLLKDFTYGVAYGAGRNGLLEVAEVAARDAVDGDDLLFEETFSRYAALVDEFLKLPLIVDLMAGRDRALLALQQKRRNGEAVIDDLGEPVPNSVPPLKVLVRLNQATELRIAAAGALVAAEEGVLMAWQHDGWSVRYSQPDRMGAIERRMMAAVEQEGLALGVPSKLELKKAEALKVAKAA